MKNHDAASFNNPLTRRTLYKRAHSDPKLAEWIAKTDPLYGKRGKLTRFENTVNDVIVGVTLPFMSAFEFIIGHILFAFEGENPTTRSRGGQVYDDVVYSISDPFHRKRLLYDLSGVLKKTSA